MRLLVALLLLLCAQPASAQPAPSLTPEALSNAYRCAEVQDDAARLACYDDAIGRLRQAEAAGQIVALDREGVDGLQRDSFGFSLPNFARLIPGVGSADGSDATLERIEMQVDRIISLPYGRHNFVMSNGQIWAQTEAQSAANVRVGDTVTVRRAAMGSFLLSPARNGAAHRVRRQD